VILIVAVIGFLFGLDPYALIKNEGIISFTILVVIVIYKAIYNAVRGKDTNEKIGQIIMAKGFLLLVSVVAAAFVMSIEASLLKKLDEIVFGIVLGG
jgi:membrane glycosyltransferase